MATFLITYDLKEGQDYEDLYKGIMSIGGYWHGMQNVWFVKTPLSASNIRDSLTAHVKANDKLFVCELDHWASYNLSGADWLN